MDWQTYAVYIIFFGAVALLAKRIISALLSKVSRNACPGCDSSCEIHEKKDEK